MRIIAREKAEQSVALVDPWTAVHFSSGLGFGLMNVGFWPSMAVNVGYEVLEYHFQRDKRGIEFFQVSQPENPSNSVTDMLVFALGWYLGRKWNKTSGPEHEHARTL